MFKCFKCCQCARITSYGSKIPVCQQLIFIEQEEGQKELVAQNWETIFSMLFTISALKFCFPFDV